MKGVCRELTRGLITDRRTRFRPRGRRFRRVATFLATLGSYLTDLGGSLESKAGGYLATFEDRRIAIRFETGGRG